MLADKRPNLAELAFRSNDGTDVAGQKKPITPKPEKPAFHRPAILVSVLFLCVLCMIWVPQSMKVYGLEEEVTPQQLLQNVIDSQHALKDFTADAKMELFLNKTRFPVSMKIFARRPNATAVKVMGITVQSKGGFLLPSPSVFLNSGDYNLAIVGTKYTARGKEYIISATPKVNTTAKTTEGQDKEAAKSAAPVTAKAATQEDAELYSWRLEIAANPWIVAAAEAWNKSGESTRMEAKYKEFMEGCWLPIEFEGQGTLLLRSALPEGFINWLFNLVSGGKKVTYRLTLSEVKVNVGIPDSMFK